MAQIIWTEPALSDLNDIAEYIALDKLLAAKQLVKNVFSSVSRLDQFPESGKKPAEISDTQYREVVSGPCRIFYRFESDIVYILYVMRSERKLRQYIIDDRKDKTP